MEFARFGEKTQGDSASISSPNCHNCVTLFCMRFVYAAPLYLFCLMGPGWASSPITPVICAAQDDMIQRLTVDYGAQKISTGLRGPEAIVEIWAAEQGDWTLVQTYADGTSCILAMGEHWQDMRPMEPKT